MPLLRLAVDKVLQLITGIAQSVKFSRRLDTLLCSAITPIRLIKPKTQLLISPHKHHLMSTSNQNRATNHITADLNNLTLHAEYTGPDQIQMGNGTYLDIHPLVHLIYSPLQLVLSLEIFCMCL